MNPSISNSPKEPAGDRRPRFSVLIPTRDRPLYVRNALESVLNQTYRDFEVIVVDNFKNSSCKSEVGAFNDPRIRYVVPPAPLAMHDNWEYAIDQARGDFVLILIDKTLLRLTALERLQAATISHPAEIYSWTADAYCLTEESAGDNGRGFIVPVRGAGEPFYVDCQQEMAARLSFQQRIGSEGPSYCYGKICFGAYSRELIARIKSRFGRVCDLVSPDYTCKTVALLSTDRLVDLNGSYTISMITSISNGMLFSQNTTHARQFLATADMGDKDFAEMPIPNVFCSLHNICAFDWRMIGQNYISDRLDMAMVYIWAERDLGQIKHWSSDAEKAEIHSHMRKFLEGSPIELRERIVDLKHQLLNTEQAARERQSADHESWVKGREDYVKFREDTALVRENNALIREQAVTAREVNVGAREALAAKRDELARALDTETDVIFRVYRLLRRMKHAVFNRSKASGPAVELSSAAIVPEVITQEAVQPSVPDSPVPNAWPMQEGYPVFANTLMLLRYAETELFVYPLPVPPFQAAA